MRKSWALLCIVTALSSCSSVSTISLGSSKNQKTYPPVSEEQVIVLRMEKPPVGVKEFALINISTGEGKVEDWYKKVRKEAGKRGAHFVSDMKISSKLVQQCSNSCVPNGGCTTTCTHVPLFSISGTMGRMTNGK